ncbi:MAG: minor capsid protein [Lachnospiraceae bacterium]
MVTNTETYIKKTIVYYTSPTIIEKGRLDTYDPSTIESVNYKNWKAILDLRTCTDCRSRHGQIYSIDEIPDVQPPLHPNCRCEINPMESIFAGEATKDGDAGADFWLKYFGKLPGYYISKEEAMNKGWRPGKSPVKFAPGKMITKGIYFNENGHLPQADGRIWYEADINYYEGKRNKHRVLWSNDGLIFVTYDHYETFYEIIGEDYAQ